MQIVTTFEDARLRLVVDQGLCVARWLDSPQPHHFPHVTTAMRRAAEETTRAALFNVVDAKGKMPRFDDAVRQSAAKMARDITPVAAATAHVLLLDGFSGAAVRMFLSTLTLLMRSSAPTSVHATVAAGAIWLAERAPAGWTAARIEAVYAALRA